MKNIILMAPIAAGKGTQSALLKDEFNYVSISTGDMFREIVASNTELGEKIKNIINSGALVDDELTVSLVSKKLDEIQGKPFILDGFPRNKAQALILNKLMEEKNLDYQVIYLDLSEETAMKRTLGRLMCKCGRSYNVYFPHLKPKVDNICDNCGESLFKRDEDNEETFKLRYNNLMENLKPALELYKDLGKLSVINAEASVEEIFANIKEVINL